MKPNLIRSLAAAAGGFAILCAVTPARAEIVDLHLWGRVSYLAAIDYAPGSDTPEFTTVPVLGDLSVGEGFELHFVVDTEADRALSADLVLAGGARYFAVASDAPLPFWNADGHLLYLQSEQDQPKYFGGLHLSAPAVPAEQVVTLQEMVDFYREGPDRVDLYAPLYECGGSMRDCSSGSVSFVVTGVSASAVPEPSSLALLLAGVAVAAAVSSRRS